MKLWVIFALLITTNAFAENVCSFPDTATFSDSLEAKGIKPSKTSKNHKRFTFVEKQMIHLTITQQEWLSSSSKEQSLEIFGDFHNGQVGYNAGQIEYYMISGKQIAIVHYWPGENEYGAVFEMKNSSYTRLGKISDGEIDCR